MSHVVKPCWSRFSDIYWKTTNPFSNDDRLTVLAQFIYGYNFHDNEHDQELLHEVKQVLARTPKQLFLDQDEFVSFGVSRHPARNQAKGHKTL